VEIKGSEIGHRQAPNKLTQERVDMRMRPISVIMTTATGGTDRGEKAEVATITQAAQLSTGILLAENTKVWETVSVV
jgi:hypothetical protein